MKNITKEILYTLAASALVVSCAKDVVVDDPGQVGGGSSAISFGADITRATDTEFEDNDGVYVYAYTEDGDSSTAYYKYSGETFTAESPFMKADNEKLSYVAFYPHPSYGSAITDESAYTFTVKADQSAENGYAYSDLMSSVVAATDVNTPMLTFNHLMTKLVVNLDSETLPNIASAEVVLDMVGEALYDLTSSSLTSVANETMDITMAASGDEAGFKAVVAPQTVEARTTFGTITADGETFYLYNTAATTLEAGSVYTVNVNVESANSIEVTFTLTSIGSWDDDTSLSGSLKDVETVDIQIGTYYTSDKTFSNLSTTENIIGVVYYIDEENETAKVVSLEERESSQWAAANTTIFVTGAAYWGSSGINQYYWIARGYQAGGVTQITSTTASNINNYYILDWAHELNNVDFSESIYYDGAQNLWFVPSLDEMAELYVGMSGKKLVDMVTDADTQICYNDWHAGWYDPATGEAIAWDGSQTRAGVAIPGTNTTETIAARAAFNAKISAVEGTTIDDKIYHTARESGYNACVIINYATYGTSTIGINKQTGGSYPARAIMNVSTSQE